MARRALVLGGGGITGVGWEHGILSGLLEAGVDLSTADLVVGTSAGSAVGAIVCGGESLEAAYQRQINTAGGEVGARVGLGVILRYVGASVFSRDPQHARAKIGAMALRTKTVAEQVRREAIVARLAGADWPTTQQLLI